MMTNKSLKGLSVLIRFFTIMIFVFGISLLVIGCSSRSVSSKQNVNMMCIQGENKEWYIIHDGNIIDTILPVDDVDTYTSLNGSTKLFLFVSDNNSSVRTLYVGKNDKFEKIADYCHDFDMSDNGKYIAYIDFYYRLHLYDAEKMIDSEIDQVIKDSSICISPTGKVLLYYNQDGYLSMCEIQSIEKTNNREIKGKIEGYSLCSVDDSADYIYARNDYSVYWLDKNGRQELAIEYKRGYHTTIYEGMVNRDHTQMLNTSEKSVYIIDHGKVQYCCEGTDVDMITAPDVSCRGINIDVYDVENLKDQLYLVEHAIPGSYGYDYHSYYWRLDHEEMDLDSWVYNIKIGKDGHTLYYVNEDDRILYSSDFNNFKKSKAILTDVDDFYLDSNDRLFFECEGSLYLHDKKGDVYICSDVRKAIHIDDGGLAFLCEWNGKSRSGILITVRNDQIEYISDNVSPDGLYFGNKKCIFLRNDDYPTLNARLLNCYLTDFSSGEHVTSLLIENCNH